MKDFFASFIVPFGTVCFLWHVFGMDGPGWRDLDGKFLIGFVTMVGWAAGMVAGHLMIGTYRRKR